MSAIVTNLSRPATGQQEQGASRNLLNLLSFNARSQNGGVAAISRHVSLNRSSSNHTKNMTHDTKFIEEAAEDKLEDEANAIKIAIAAGSGDCVHHILNAVLDGKVTGVTFLDCVFHPLTLSEPALSCPRHIHR